MPTAAEMLDVWSFRMKMQEDAVTHPSDSARTATRLLVERLSQIDGQESIAIEQIEGDKLHAKIIRVATGETLSEFREEG